jgi:hypothetical protein
VANAVNDRIPWRKCWLLALILAVSAPKLAGAGALEDPAPTQPGTEAAAEPASSEPEFLLPDLMDASLVHDGKRFWIRPVIAILTDYTFFDQDDASLAQVGLQDDTFDLRAARFGFALRSKSELVWEAFVAVDYLERRTREDDSFQLYDLCLRFPFG